MLTQSYPDALTKEEVAVKTGYEANGGGFNNALGRLRVLKLVQGRGEIKTNASLGSLAVVLPALEHEFGPAPGNTAGNPHETSDHVPRIG